MCTKPLQLWASYVRNIGQQACQEPSPRLRALAFNNGNRKRCIASMLITGLQCLNPLIHKPKAQNAELSIQVLETWGPHFNVVTMSGSASDNAARNPAIPRTTHQNPCKYTQTAFCLAPQTLYIVTSCPCVACRILYIVTSCPCVACRILRKSFTDRVRSSHTYFSRDVQLWGPLHLLITHILCFLLQVA